jgi:hypothetical protein
MMETGTARKNITGHHGLLRDLYRAYTLDGYCTKYEHAMTPDDLHQKLHNQK